MILMASCGVQAQIMFLSVLGLGAVGQAVTIITGPSCSLQLKLWPLTSFILFYFSGIYESIS